jgi:hypothetical protein
MEKKITIMEYCYIKFDTSNNNKKENCCIAIKRIKNTLIKAITNILPSSDPDYDEDYDEVINYAEKWLVEFEKKTEHPNREIGIDHNNKVIIKSPWAGRYAYWADVNLKLTDFKRNFNAKEINRQEFELLWNNFNINQ